MEIDVVSIDKKICDIWKKTQESIITIENNIKELVRLSVEDISPHIKKDILQKIETFQADKRKFEEVHKNRHFYTMEFYELMENHKTQMSKPKKISFMGSKEPNENSNIAENYIKIVKKYCGDLDIEKYIDPEHVEKLPKKSLIKKCKCDSLDFVSNQDQSVEICEVCGNQEEKSHNSVGYKDMSRINMTNKYSYERSVHFRDCINQYQGKQNATVDDKVYKDIEEQLELHGKLKPVQIGENKKKRFENITKDQILLFLKETGHSKHYEDVFLIYHKMTGKKIDDFTYLENKLMEDFENISETYDKLFKFTGKVDRKSFINTQYILYQLLRRHKHPCDKKNFNMLKSLDRKAFHDTICSEIFEHLGFNFFPLF